MKISLSIFCCFVGLLSTCWSLQSQTIELQLEATNDSQNYILKSLNKTPNYKDLKSLFDGLKTLQNELHKQGFIEAYLKEFKQTSPKKYTASFDLKIKYQKIILNYQKEIYEALENLDLAYMEYKGGKIIIPLEKLENTMENIVRYFVENAYPFTTVQLSNITTSNNSNLQADIVLDVDTKRQLDKVIIKGYSAFPKSYIKHFLKLKNNIPFNLSEIRSKTKRLDQLTFAYESKPSEILFRKDSTSAYLYLEKTKSNNFDGYLGFGSNENNGKLELNGYVNLSLINNLNYGESIKLNYINDENAQKTLNINIQMPYVLNSPLGIDLELNIFKKDSLFSTAQQSIQLFYNLSSMQKISGGIKKIESSNLSSNTEFNTTDYSTQLFEALYLFEKRQNRDLLFPIKQQLKLIYSNGQRTSNSLKTPQEIILLKAQNIFNINKKNSLFLGFQAEQIRSDNLQFNELRRFGGIQSLRGFEENSLYASSYALLNTEYRFRINNSFYLHTIADIAFMEDNNLESKKLYGFGLGFGIRTNAGLFNINYANGSTNQQDFDFAKSKVHISLKTTF